MVPRRLREPVLLQRLQFPLQLARCGCGESLQTQQYIIPVASLQLDDRCKEGVAVNSGTSIPTQRSFVSRRENGTTEHIASAPLGDHTPTMQLLAPMVFHGRGFLPAASLPHRHDSKVF